ncbi:late embryogenesis abundant protein D-34 isoform X2 [Cucumis melo]|uniref:Late embryogenesis abundant protein D-34 isoform X2 n=1 Tax=Cucumis melo TaxID=3656 RepID=A0ABM3KWA2_CUCME|nr:late embryogenesis abundant protein D-34 isoform X2 [Cucumis melo]
MAATTSAMLLPSFVQEQPRRDEQLQQPRQNDDEQLETIKYGDVFNVSGDLAANPIAPEDARMMASAETRVLGQMHEAGPADVMRAAAAHNVQVGVLSSRDISDVAKNQGINISETDVPGARVVSECVAGQYLDTTTASGVEMPEQDVITIGQALEAACQIIGNKPVEQSDAAAIHAAEVCATGNNAMNPGGLGATAQAAAIFNAAMDRDEDKIKLNYVLTGATEKLATDKVVSRQDVEGVVSAELRNNPSMTTHPGGVAASISAAARLNEGNTERVVSADLRNNPNLTTHPDGLAASITATAGLNEDGAGI